ncbi:MAG: ABC transporter ATP-binding protein, partial [Planctomycetes bacterium]|nr:ABC transporter ATP-binding protein [Planctomycetota bacterium]
KGVVLACDSVDNLITTYGGRSVVEAELDGKPSEAASRLGPVRDGVLRFEAADASDGVSRLKAAGIGYRSLHVRRPDLETVFLELTGRRLRDA